MCEQKECILDGIIWSCLSGNINMTRWSAENRNIFQTTRCWGKLEEIRLKIHQSIVWHKECYIDWCIDVSTAQWWKIRKDNNKSHSRMIFMFSNYFIDIYGTHFNWMLNCCFSETITIASCVDISTVAFFCWHLTCCAGWEGAKIKINYLY